MSDIVPSEGLIVGASQRPDGSWDMSHSLRMAGEWKISDPIVDRLRGLLQVDMAKEERYQSFQTTLQHEMEQGNLPQWFIGLMNQIKPSEFPDVTPEDIKSLKFVTEDPQLQALRKQFGHNYSRPYFQLNLADYQKVYKKLTGHLGSNGCTISGEALALNEVTKGINLVIAPGLGPDILHEITHSIDPNMGKRSPSEEVLEEFATYYQEVYQPRVFTQTTVQTDAQGNRSEPVTTSREVYATIPNICQTLKDELYVNNYAQHFASKEQYFAKVDQIGDMLKQLGEYMKPQDIHRAILNAKSAYELGHLVDVSKREKN